MTTKQIIIGILTYVLFNALIDRITEPSPLYQARKYACSDLLKERRGNISAPMPEDCRNFYGLPK